MNLPQLNRKKIKNKIEQILAIDSNYYHRLTKGTGF